MPLPPNSRGEIGKGRILRKRSSISEKVAWSFLRRSKSGFKFRRQHEVGIYVLDFYCAEASVCVEIDGEHHADRVHLDRARDTFLAGLGILTIRIPSVWLFDPHGTQAVEAFAQVVRICEQRSGRSACET